MRTNGRLLRRTSKDLNEIIEYPKDGYAEIVLYQFQRAGTEAIEKSRCLIDIDDIDTIKRYKWKEDSYGYVVNTKNQTLIHRLILDPASNMVVDHINHNTLDNRRSNLRVCAHRDNLKNLKWHERANLTKSKYKGVYWDDKCNTWYARITVNGETIHLGRRKNIEDAISLRKEAEVKYFKEFRYRGDIDE